MKHREAPSEEAGWNIIRAVYKFSGARFRVGEGVNLTNVFKKNTALVPDRYVFAGAGFMKMRVTDFGWVKE
jgi:hypothetical protein